jgi:hypothetical protein
VVEDVAHELRVAAWVLLGEAAGDMVRLSSCEKDTPSSRCSAEFRPTGTLTSPKLMLPFQSARGITIPPG